jgi:hypothetical protein
MPLWPSSFDPIAGISPEGSSATAASNGLAVRIPLTFREGIDSIVRHGTSASLLFYGPAVILLTRGKGWGDFLTRQRSLHFAARSRWPCPADVALFTRAAGRGWRGR